MSFLYIWTIVAVSYQTIICLVISWLTLSCKLSPSPDELHEVTLIKLLYLYDPDACGKLYFYNYTIQHENSKSNYSPIFWPVQNHIAAAFRYKIQVWMSFHIVWAFFCIVYMVQEQRPCTFYFVLLPFTITGISILCIDLVYAVLFFIDACNTGNEVLILEYIDLKEYPIQTLYAGNEGDFMPNSNEDTSWVALLLAYGCMRGVVQWIVNFWIIKDNYVEGLAIFRAGGREQSKYQYS